MTQKNVPVPSAPEASDSGDSTTSAKSNASQGPPAEPRSAVMGGPPRGQVPRLGTPTSFTPVSSPVPQQTPMMADDPESEEDDAPTMGPTPLIDLDQPTVEAPPPPSFRPLPPPPPMFGRPVSAFPTPSSVPPLPPLPPRPSPQTPSGALVPQRLGSPLRPTPRPSSAPGFARRRRSRSPFAPKLRARSAPPRSTSSGRAPTRSCSTQRGLPDRARLRPLREGVPRRGALGRVEDRLPARRS